MPPPSPSGLVLVLSPTAKKKPVFGCGAYARQAIECLYRVQVFNPFFLYAFVVMPDHCKLLIELPAGASLTALMKVWRRAVAFEIGMPVWQAQVQWKEVDDISRAISTIHSSPVKEKLCVMPDEYPWSSASGRWNVCELPKNDSKTLEATILYFPPTPASFKIVAKTAG